MEWWKIIILIATCIIIVEFLLKILKHSDMVLYYTGVVVLLIIEILWFIIKSPLLIFNSIWQFFFLRNQKQSEGALTKQYEKLLNVTEKKRLKAVIKKMNFLDTKIRKFQQKAKEREGRALLNRSKWGI